MDAKPIIFRLMIFIFKEIIIKPTNTAGTVAKIIGKKLIFILPNSKYLFLNKYKSRAIKFFLAGMFQCLAFIPGFSRSASCIIAFRLLGEERRVSSIYSLYLGIPIITISFLSNFKDLKNMFIDINLVIIFIVTFISAYITLNLFINFINKISFTPFVIYRILLGLIILSIF